MSISPFKQTVMLKREYERRKREEQEATAHVFQEFIDTFQNVSTNSKTFIKSEILYSDKKQIGNVNEVYNPKPLMRHTVAVKNALECATMLKDSKANRNKNEKRISNLEMLKEELKQRHSEKDERERLKEQIAMSSPAISYFDGGDPLSTNLFVANLNTSVTEAVLMEEFGVFGSLASVKIMWPRGEDKFKNCHTNCGFVAYMSRRDAERALNHMKHRTDMRVGWGKSVELPPHPIYIPQELLRLYLPPPQSGLPFNAQTNTQVDLNVNEEGLNDILADTVIKVTIPLNKKVLTLVNRMVEFVVKEGPLFEAIIMNTEMGNPDFNFLFDNKSPIHVYYRWKLFSILHGESTKYWSMKPFRMFIGGSVWIPPVAPDFTQGMPECLIVKSKNDITKLSDNQCERFIDIIQNLSLKRSVIADAMVFCINHSSAIDDAFNILTESLSNMNTKIVDKVSRMYLLSDVLSNCVKKGIKINNIHSILDNLIEHLHVYSEHVNNEADKDDFFNKIMRVIRQLDIIGMLCNETIKRTEVYFNKNYLTTDGNSSSDEPLDGVKLLKHSLKGSSEEIVLTPAFLKQKQMTMIPKEYFVPSKWDKLDPDEVESQAILSSQLNYLNPSSSEIELKKCEDKSKIKRRKSFEIVEPENKKQASKTKNKIRKSRK